MCPLLNGKMKKEGKFQQQKGWKILKKKKMKKIFDGCHSLCQKNDYIFHFN